MSRDSRQCFFHESVSPSKLEKNFKLKNFNNFVWAPLGSRVNMYKIFAFKFTLRCLKPDIVFIICHRCQQHKRNWWQNLPPVSLILVENLPPVTRHRCRCYRREFATGVIDTGGAPWLANISMTLMLGLRGRWFMKKTWSKNLVTLSL